MLGLPAESSDHLILVHGLKYLMALPLSAGKKVESEFVHGALSDVLSAPVKFFLGAEEPLSVSIFSSLASSAISTGSGFTDVFAAVRIS